MADSTGNHEWALSLYSSHSDGDKFGFGDARYVYAKGFSVAHDRGNYKLRFINKWEISLPASLPPAK